MIKKAGVR